MLISGCCLACCLSGHSLLCGRRHRWYISNLCDIAIAGLVDQQDLLLAWANRVGELPRLGIRVIQITELGLERNGRIGRPQARWPGNLHARSHPPTHLRHSGSQCPGIQDRYRSPYTRIGDGAPVADQGLRGLDVCFDVSSLSLGSPSCGLLNDVGPKLWHTRRSYALEPRFSPSTVRRGPNRT